MTFEFVQKQQNNIEEGENVFQRNSSMTKKNRRSSIREEVKRDNSIYFTPAYRELKPYEKTNILITIDCLKPEIIAEHLQIVIESAPS